MGTAAGRAGPMSAALPEPLLLFDGECNLCSSVVQFVIRNDKHARIRFASLQSPIGQRVLADVGMRTDDLETFVLLDNGRTFVRSTAALRVSGHLDGPLKMFRVLTFVPRPIRDAIYRFVARRRYRWFGRRAECWLPTPELRSRFVE